MAPFKIDEALTLKRAKDQILEDHQILAEIKLLDDDWVGFIFSKDEDEVYHALVLEKHTEYRDRTSAYIVNAYTQHITPTRASQDLINHINNEIADISLCCAGLRAASKPSIGFSIPSQSHQGRDNTSTRYGLYLGSGT